MIKRLPNLCLLYVLIAMAIPKEITTGACEI